MAISDAPRTILAIGASARSAGGQLINPFSHPRLVAHNFEVTEKLFQHAFSVVSKAKKIAPAPEVVIHVLDELEGGITDLERRFLLETVLGAGAFKAYFWHGPELSKQQLREGLYQHEAM